MGGGLLLPAEWIGHDPMRHSHACTSAPWAGTILKLGDFGIARVLNSDTELARTVVSDDAWQGHASLWPYDRASLHPRGARSGLVVLRSALHVLHVLQARAQLF